jgi:hypothetical protein
MAGHLSDFVFTTSRLELDPDVGCPQPLHVNTEMLPQLRPQSPPSTAFPTVYSTVDTLYSELLITWINKLNQIYRKYSNCAQDLHVAFESECKVSNAVRTNVLRVTYLMVLIKCNAQILKTQCYTIRLNDLL